MPGVAAGLGRRSWSIGSMRFLRDVTASVLAAGIAAVGFSHLAHEPAPPARDISHGKNLDRLTWVLEDIPTRATRTYDSLAMFAMPRVEANAWSEAPVLADASRPNTSLRTAQIERRDREPRRLAAMPPTRPAALAPEAIAERADIAQPLSLASVQAASGLRVFGWQVPGTDLLQAALPAGQDVLNGAARVGGKIAGMGQALVETVGLKSDR